MNRYLRPALALAALALGLTGPATVLANPLAQLPGPCVVSPHKTVEPEVLLAGETVKVSLSVRADCTGPTRPVHLMLVLDASGSMVNPPGSALKDVVTAAIDRLELPTHPQTQVGVVQFDYKATALCAITNDEALVKGCVARLGSWGAGAVDRGIVEGLRELRRAREAAALDVGPKEVMILVADGDIDAGCNPLKSAAHMAKGQRVQIITISLGKDVDAACMRAIASSARYASHAASPEELEDVFHSILPYAMPEQTLRYLTIRETIPDTMELVRGSVVPPAEMAADGTSLTWDAFGYLAGDFTVSFELRPMNVGHQATNFYATADYIDPYGAFGTLDFPIRYVTVFGAPRAPRSGIASSSAVSEPRINLRTSP